MTEAPYPEFPADLRRTVESEVLGQRLFSVAARLARTAERERKWRALEALEIETLRQACEYAERRETPTNAPAGTALRGLLLGIVLGLLPWRLSMRLLEDGTGPFLAVFERMASKPEPGAEPFLEHLVAHERAIERFAQLERAGEAAGSLEAVEQLLPAGKGARH